MPNDDKIARELLTLGVFLQREGNRLLRPFDLTQQQFVVLNEIVRRQNVSQKELVSELLVEKSHVSKIIKKLNNAQLIYLTASSVDKRIIFLRPTKQGKIVQGKSISVVRKWNREWLGSISCSTKRDLSNALEDLEDIID